MTKKYEVNKTYTSGILASIPLTIRTTVLFKAMQEYKDCVTGNKYIVTSVKEA